MLGFRSEAHVDAWCEKRELPKRPLVSLDQQWELAVAWYENRLTEDSRRPGPEEAAKIFQNLGLEGPFWDLQSDRF